MRSPDCDCAICSFWRDFYKDDEIKNLIEILDYNNIRLCPCLELIRCSPDFIHLSPQKGKEIGYDVISDILSTKRISFVDFYHCKLTNDTNHNDSGIIVKYNRTK